MENAVVKKKLSVSDLIANAETIKAKKNETKDLYVKALDATVTIKKADRTKILDSYGMGEGEGNSYLVYECVVDPNFKDSQLQAAYGAVGYEVLEKIFDAGEIDTIAKEIVGFAGYGDGAISVVEDIKN